MSAVVRLPAGDRVMAWFAQECELVSKLAQDTKTLLASVEARALRPRPLRKLSFRELSREEQIVNRLLLASVKANATRIQELLDAEAEECLLESITGEQRPLPPAVIGRRPEDDCVISPRLEQLLRLRIQLCRSEISRRKHSRRQASRSDR